VVLQLFVFLGLARLGSTTNAKTPRNNSNYCNKRRLKFQICLSKHVIVAACRRAAPKCQGERLWAASRGNRAPSGKWASGMCLVGMLQQRWASSSKRLEWHIGLL